MKSESIPSAYDPFAWVYNQHWGHTFLPTILPILENLILSRMKKGARILDLCCGTGQLSQRLNALGYSVTGIDGSSAMLKYARENAPGVRFIHADARNFTISRKFHTVVSVFDSLNHILTLKELTNVFHSVNRVLQPGGLFLLDLNTEAGYLKEWQGDFTIVEEDHVCVVQNSYRPGTRIATFDATIFRLTDGSWYRTDIMLYQKCHAPSRVISALEAAGFTGIETFGFDMHFGVQPLAKEMRRAFFFCRKD